MNLHACTSDQLVDLLSHRNHWYADRARVLLAERRDASVVSRLRQLALQHEDPQRALQGLWALYGTTGLDDATALELLDHSFPYVRSWTVRLVGDRRSIRPTISRRLIALAETEASAIVRCQLAATAKRLPGTDALPIIKRILDRDLDDDDPYVPWLSWWAIEAKAISDRAQVMEIFARVEVWQNGSYRGNIRRLMRRYAAEGSEAGYEACSRLLAMTPEHQRDQMLEALDRGLSERASQLHRLGQGGLYEQFAAAANDPSPTPPSKRDVTGPLRSDIVQLWQTDANDPLRLRLAIRAGVDEAYDHLLQAILAAGTGDKLRESMLQIALRLGDERCVPVVLPLIGGDNQDALQLTALDVLARFQTPSITKQLLSQYPSMTPAAKSRSRRILLSRAESARLFLDQVERAIVLAEEVPLDDLRGVALHEDQQLDALVRKHWGTISVGTPEEKLATMRRLNNDLRTGSGDVARGKNVFERQCGVCHRLFREGNSIGPDLTNTSRKDRDYLLASCVDPSAVIGRQFLGYVVGTTTGRLLTGLIVEQDAASITLLDAKNQRTRIAREEVEQIHPSETSLMPDNTVTTLEPQALRDLFAYLQQ